MKKTQQQVSETHAKFYVEAKVVFTCIDNGSNVVKAFTESAKAKHLTADNAVWDVTSSDDEQSDAEDEALAAMGFDLGLLDTVSKHQTAVWNPF